MNLRATRAEIDISQLRSNIAICKKMLSKQVPVCLTVKANAYGHGAIEIAKYTQDVVDMFGVATLSEAIELRQSGIQHPIFLFSAHLKKEIPLICQYKITPIISHGEFLDEYQKYALQNDLILPIHLKIDTGMGRSGVFPDQVLSLVQKIQQYSHVLLEGICTHFASADLGDQGELFTKNQIKQFNWVLDQLQQNHISIPYIHAANSAGIQHYPDSTFNLVRLGIAAYGFADHQDIKPILSLKTRISLIKTIPKGFQVSYGGTWIAPEDTTIAVLPIGYADGYFRCLSNNSFVLINDIPCPIIGNICMDQMIVSLPKGQFFLEQDVLVYGNHSKLNPIVIAQLSKTIPYEVLTSISQRVPRIYLP